MTRRRCGNSKGYRKAKLSGYELRDSVASVGVWLSLSRVIIRGSGGTAGLDRCRVKIWGWEWVLCIENGPHEARMEVRLDDDDVGIYELEEWNQGT